MGITVFCVIASDLPQFICLAEQLASFWRALNGLTNGSTLKYISRRLSCFSIGHCCGVKVTQYNVLFGVRCTDQRENPARTLGDALRGPQHLFFDQGERGLWKSYMNRRLSHYSSRCSWPSSRRMLTSSVRPSCGNYSERSLASGSKCWMADSWSVRKVHERPHA